MCSVSDLRDVFDRLWTSKRKIALATLGSLLLGLTYLWLATPIYSATASLFVDPRARIVNEAVPGGISPDIAWVESQAAILISDGVLKNVVKTLKLSSDLEFAAEKSPLQRTLSGLLIRGKSEESPDERALLSLKKALKVSRAQNTYVLDITATSALPAKAVAIVQSVIDAYFADQIKTNSADAQRTGRPIDARLDALRKEVLDAEVQAEDYKKANKILASKDGGVSEQQLTRMNAELVTAQGVTAESKARRDQIQSAIDAGTEPDALGEAVRSSLITKLREQYAELARREASLSLQLQPKHPVMIDVRSQLNSVKLQIKAELHRLASAAEAEYQLDSNREKKLAKQLEKAKQDVSTLHAAQLRARELDENVTTSHERLSAFLARAKKAEQQANITFPDARVISPPAAPNAPVKPMPLLVLAMSVLAGLGVGAAWALNDGTGEKTIRTAAHFFQQTGIASISVIPELRSATTASTGVDLPYGVQFSDLLAALGPSRDRDAGAYHQAVLRLLLKIKSQGRAGRPNTVMFAAPRSGAGNSAAVLAVAYSSALSGERVLLVDATSINPELSSIFATDLAKSTTVILDSKEHLNKITTRDARSGLSFLPIALADLRTLRVQQRRRLVAGLNLISQDYDWIFIDAGALLDDESATTLLPATTQVFVVGRSGTTSRNDVDDLLEILEPVRDRISGAVLTFGSPHARA